MYPPNVTSFVIDLKPGDLLQSLADGDTENTSSEVESLELYLPKSKTYNLTVYVGYTFYVGELKTWVHNTGPCDLPSDYFEGGAKGVEIPNQVNKPLGLGSTGRTTPANLNEKLAIEQAISNPTAGRPLRFR